MFHYFVFANRVFRQVITIKITDLRTNLGCHFTVNLLLKKVFERPKRVDLIKQTVKCTVAGCLFCFIPLINDLLLINATCNNLFSVIK